MSLRITPARGAALLCAVLLLTAPSRAQVPAAHDMAGMDHGAMTMDHAAPDHAMRAMLGPYPMTREASGTAWQPDSAPMLGVMGSAGGWQLMTQGWATGVYDRQGGPRGDSKTFSQSMGMVMANRAVGAGGILGVRAMASLDPLMGKSGYPLLFATGETADGRSELVDRQHPHDLLMELGVSYAQAIGGGLTASLYAGLPGEPALGPPTFMHRMSGFDTPEAPITHHWFDSTHITWGVVTAGLGSNRWKIEASAFKGREPDQHRWDVESPRLDSWSVRAFWNPTADLSLQASTGHLRSPEQLHPDDDEQRTTVSASWNRKLAAGGNFAATIAWSLKDAKPGPALHALLAEASLRLRGRHILFARAERAEEIELFESGLLHDTNIPVAKLSVGVGEELAVAPHLRLMIGALASAYAYPARIVPAYGRDGIKSAMLFTRLRWGN